MPGTHSLVFNFALRRKFKPLFSTTMSLYFRQNLLLCESAPKESDTSIGIRSPVGPVLPDSSGRSLRSRFPGALTVSRSSLTRSSLFVAPAVLRTRGAHRLAPVANTELLIRRSSDPFPSINSTLSFVQSVPFSWEQATSSFDTRPNEVPAHSWLWKKNFL